MDIRDSLEHLYLALTTKRSFPSGSEDEMQINQDMQALSEFFCETSRKRSGVKVQEVTPEQLKKLMRGYRGAKVRGIALRFREDTAS